jgi:TolB-like protein
MGMADTLILRLGGEHLKVPPIAAVRKFASPEQDPVDAGRHLGVETVLDGGIQIVAGRVRVSARLIRVRFGRLLRGFKARWVSSTALIANLLT